MAVQDNSVETIEGLSWQQQAACRGPLGSVFFPPPVTERKREKIAREQKAIQICKACPVMDDCRSYSIAIREPHGVWGGLSEKERRLLL